MTRTVLLLAALLGAAQPVAAAPSEPVLVRADVVTAQPIEAAATGGTGGDVSIGTTFRVRLRVRAVLLGSLPASPNLTTLLPMASEPADRHHRDIYVLFEREGASLRPVNWDTTASGICIDAAFARSHGVGHAVRTLTRKGLVRCD